MTETRQRSGIGSSNAFWAPPLRVSKKHTAPGVFFGGTVLDWEDRPETDQKGEEKTYPSGDVIMMTAVLVQTDLRDATIEGGDTGLRTLYLDGIDRRREKTAVYDSRKRAARLALQATGARDLEEGGELYLAFVDDDREGKGSIAPQHFAAVYRRPADATGVTPTPLTVAKSTAKGKGSVPSQTDTPPF